jgi:hypothetical protein
MVPGGQWAIQRQKLFFFSDNRWTAARKGRNRALLSLADTI